MNELWYKNAIFYAVDVFNFKDSDGDGIGDFTGLTSKTPYLADLGVTCVWLLPFYPTPYRDNGYDVMNYYEVDPRVGTLDDFLEFLHRAGEQGIRVLLDLVINHTSDQHPWFQAARHDRESRYRDYYVWSEEVPPASSLGTIFPGEEDTVWTYDEVAGAYYYHRFYHFQPELQPSNPEVVEEIKKIMDFWLSFGVAGFRVDAASHLIEQHGSMPDKSRDSHDVLREMCSFASKRGGNVVLLGEADVPVDELASFFGNGDELNLLFNFLLSEYLFLAFAEASAESLERLLRQFPTFPHNAQVVNFLRNLDELDLEQLNEKQRQKVFETFAPDPKMRIYQRGIRRRVAPMLGGDRRRLELAFSLLFSLPGTPLLVYGDEIAMGDDLTQPGRNAVRTPMQWSSEPHAGFSPVEPSPLIQPIIAQGPFSHERVNVAQQQEAPDSFLNWMKRLISLRRKRAEVGYGDWQLVESEEPTVVVLAYEWRQNELLVLHNLSPEPCRITVDLEARSIHTLVPLFGNATQKEEDNGTCRIGLPAYGYQWYAVDPKK